MFVRSPPRLSIWYLLNGNAQPTAKSARRQRQFRNIQGDGFDSLLDWHCNGGSGDRSDFANTRLHIGAAPSLVAPAGKRVLTDIDTPCSTKFCEGTNKVLTMT